MEIGGLTAGAGYDRLSISGTATLAGTLDLLLINGFDPGVGAAFQILSFGSIVNQFTILNGTIIGTKTLNFIYGATSLVLTVA